MAVAALRPDWPIKSLRTFITVHLADRAFEDAAVAFTWVATRTPTKTPRLVLEPGPWWTVLNQAGAANPRAPRPGDDCPLHPGNFPASCAGCRADRLAGDESPTSREFAPATAETRAAAAQAIRDELHRLKGTA